MRCWFYSRRVLLVSACVMMGTVAWSQQAASRTKLNPMRFDVGVTFSGEETQDASLLANKNIWMQGGGADLAVIFKHGLGAAVALNGSHTVRFNPYEIDLNLLSTMAGPRYTLRVPHVGSDEKNSMRVFGEMLVGDAYDFGTMVPTRTGSVTSTHVFAMQLGGGVNIDLQKHFGVRLLQVDYERTALPNNANNRQNDLRVAIGLNCRFGR